MKILLSFLLSIFCLLQTDAQEIIYPYGQIQSIKNNILTYRIYYLSQKVESEYKFVTKCLLPSDNETLIIKISKSELIFPDESFTIFNVTNKGYAYKEKINEERISINNSGCGYIPYSSDVLIAYKQGRLLFISGMVFKDPIAHFFHLDINQPETFNSYLALRLYNYHFESIKFIKNKRKYLIFEGYSYFKENNAKIKISKENMNHIYVKF